MHNTMANIKFGIVQMIRKAATQWQALTPCPVEREQEIWSNKIYKMGLGLFPFKTLTESDTH